MPVNLRWIASVSSSACHAAEGVARGRTIIDPRLSERIVAPCQELHDEIQHSALPAARLWRQLVGLAHQIENNRELVATAIRKTVGWQPHFESLAARLGERVAAVESTLQLAVPGIVDELANRSRPIRELWEARGPGLLSSVGKLTDPRLIVEYAEVVLVLPAFGGSGAAHLSNNSVRIEALLTNNIPELPEVVRLGWLLAQLQCDLPMFAERLSPDRLPVVAELALLPPVLQAAHDVELARYDAGTLAKAITAWQIEAPHQDAAESLLVWWQTFQETRSNWATALAALEQMLFPP